jgi:hypothetical protein
VRVSRVGRITSSGAAVLLDDRGAVLLDARGSAPGGASPLTGWDQLRSRLVG